MDTIRGIGMIALVLLLPATYITHVVECIANELWVLMAFGFFIPPVSIIHGVMVWLGIS